MNNHVESPENGDQSSRKESPISTETAGVPLQVGSFSIDDAIAMHLVDCEQCRRAIETLKPRGLGQKTGLCDRYLQLQLMRADYEGMQNNVVARTEYGHEAPQGRRLE